MSNKSNILVTGGTGLVGSHLLVLLTEQYPKVTAIYRNEARIEKVKHVFSYYDKQDFFQNINWIKADILDIPALEAAFDGVNQVYHCAAKVSFAEKDEALMRKVNIEGTANIVNISLSKNVNKLCYVSSIATLDKKPKNDLITEENEWNPESNNYDYAITKYGGEMEVWRASQEGLSVIIVKPGVILGPGYWGENTGRFFSNAANNYPFYTEGMTGFVGVQDVVKSMVKLMESEVNNEAFILVAENKTYKEVLTQIAKSIKTKTPYIKVNSFTANLAWRFSNMVSLLTGKKPLITKQTAKSSLSITRYSSEKLEKAINFSFTPIHQVINGLGRLFLQDKILKMNQKLS